MIEYPFLSVNKKGVRNESSDKEISGYGKPEFRADRPLREVKRLLHKSQVFVYFGMRQLFGFEEDISVKIRLLLAQLLPNFVSQ